MLEILKKFFRFCDKRERREFYVSIALGVAAALFSALKIPAIGVMLGAILSSDVTAKSILLSLCIMLVSVVAKLIDVGVVVLSIVQYIRGDMALLNCVMLAICSFILTEGLESAGTQSSLLRVVDTCVNQANDILTLPAMDITGEELEPEKHDIGAEGIKFSYGEKTIIDGVTLDIPEKSTTAIVGPSGGGKATLCHLLSRFWDVDEGVVKLGGHDVREYSLTLLWKR